MNEKERVYAELHDLRRKVAIQRRELDNLTKALSQPEIRAVRAERDSYKIALSVIAYSPDPKYDDVDELRLTAAAALTPASGGRKHRHDVLARAKRKLIAEQKAARESSA